MPLVRRAKPAPPAAAPDLIQRVTGSERGSTARTIGATGLRALSGILSAPGGWWGAGVSGLGETLAESVEGSEQNLGRIGVEAGIGAVPFGKIIKAGKPLESALKSGTLAGVGSVGRQLANEEDVSIGETAAHTGLGALLGGVFGRFSPTAKAAKTEEQFILEPTSRQDRARLLPRGSGQKPSVAPDNIAPDDRRFVSREIPYGYEAAGGPAEKSALREAKIAAEKEAADRIAKARKGLVPKESVSESISAPIPGGRERLSTRYVKPKGEEGDEGLGGLLGREPEVTAPSAGPVSRTASTGSSNIRAGLLRMVKEGQITMEEAELRFGGPLGKLVEPAATIPPVSVTGTTPEEAYGEAAKLFQAKPTSAPRGPRTPKSTAGFGKAIDKVLAGQKPVALDQPGLGSMTTTAEGSTISSGPLKQMTDEEFLATVRKPQPTAPIPTPIEPVAEVSKAMEGAAKPVTPPAGGAVDLRNTFPEVQTEADNLWQQYNALAKSDPAKRVVGKDIAKLRDFMSGKMREEFKGAPLLGPENAPPGYKPPTTQAEFQAELEKPIAQQLEELVQAPQPTTARGLSQTSKAREAALAARAAKRAETIPMPEGGTPPAKAKKFEDLFNKLRAEKLKGREGEKGEISNALLMRLGLGVGGATIGAATDPFDNPLASAVTGGLVGLGAADIPRLLQVVGSSPAELQTAEGVKKVAGEIYKILPQIQRSNLLWSGHGLIANAWAGPYGSLVKGGLEHWLSGDPRGLELLKLASPIRFIQEFFEGRKEAILLLQRSLGERAEFQGVEGLPASVLKFYLETPAIEMTSGDVAVRKLYQLAGFTEDEARRFTLTAEPELPLFKAIANFAKRSPFGQLLFPFRRTPANIGEQGVMRTPGLGFIAQAMRENPDPFRQQLVQQALGGGELLAGYGIGSSLDPETARVARRYVSNFGGPYSLLAATGMAAGEASAKGQAPFSTAAVRGVEQALPLPATGSVTELARYIGAKLDNEEARPPRGILPAWLYENIYPPQQANPRPLGRLRRRR